MNQRSVSTTAYPADGMRSWFLLALLFVAFIVSIMDRMVFVILIEPIKADLDLTDTQISLVQGLAFMLFYTVVSIPLGRLMDRTSRTTLLGVGAIIWSIGTAACGLAGKTSQLFFARLTVGFGEASLMPAAYSLIPDVFSRNRLGLAMGVFSLGGSLGLGGSLLVASYLYDVLFARGPVEIAVLGSLAPWQQTFIVISLPGLLIGILLLGVPEPPRRGESETQVPPWSEIFSFMKENRTWLAALFLAASMMAGLNYISITWIISFLVRAHGFTLQHAGALTGLVFMGASILGNVPMGHFGDAVSRTGGYRRLYIFGVALVIACVTTLSYPLVTDPRAALVLWCITVAAGATANGGTGANLQEYVPSRLRGVMTSLMLLVVNIVGLVGATTLVAVVSDRVFPGGDGIRYAIACVAGPVALVSGGFYFLAAVTQKKSALSTLCP